MHPIAADLHLDDDPADRGAGWILDLLIAPAPHSEFFDRHWERAPLLVSREDERRFAELLTRQQLEAYLETEDLRHPPVRLARLGGVEPASYLRSRSYGGLTIGGVVDGEALLREFAAGASIVIDRAHEVFPSLGRAAAALEHFSGLPAQASVFLTPPGAQSFPVHYDPAGVFVLQVAGRKIWRVFDQPAPWPLQEQYDPDEPLPDHGVALETELTPGCTLYVPRGHFHQVETTDSDSIHVSLGVTPLTWIKVLHRMLDELAADRAFREAPVEQVLAVRDADALRGKWRTLLERAKQVDPLIAWSEPTPAAPFDQRGRLRDLRTSAEIGMDTALRVRTDRQPYVESVPDGLRLRFADKGIHFPSGFTELLDRTLSSRTLTPSLWTDDLEANDALELARRLVREGLLTIAETG